MHDADVSAQERLQAQSLRNVRALVEKLEAEERARKRDYFLAAGWVLLGVAIVIGGYIGYRVATKPARAAISRSVPTENLTPDQYVDHVLAVVASKANSDAEAPARAFRTGAGKVKLTVRANGYSEVDLAKSSGDSTTDDAMMSLVKRSEPFGALPHSMGAERLTLLMDVELAGTPSGRSFLRVARAKP